MSGLISYKLRLAALLATALISLATVVFIIFEQTSQISALQETLHTLCTEPLLDHAQNTDSVAYKSFLGLKSSAKNSLGNSQAYAFGWHKTTLQTPLVSSEGTVYLTKCGSCGPLVGMNWVIIGSSPPYTYHQVGSSRQMANVHSDICLTQAIFTQTRVHQDVFTQTFVATPSQISA